MSACEHVRALGYVYSIVRCSDTHRIHIKAPIGMPKIFSSISSAESCAAKFVPFYECGNSRGSLGSISGMR